MWKHIYLVSTLSVEFLLIFEPFHHLFHECQCHFSIFKFWAWIVILNCCNRLACWIITFSINPAIHFQSTGKNTNIMRYRYSFRNRNLLIFSMSRESTTDFFVSSLAMALSKAFCFTILLHSWYFILASLSFGRTLTTYCNKMKIMRIRCTGQIRNGTKAYPGKISSYFTKAQSCKKFIKGKASNILHCVQIKTYWSIQHSWISHKFTRKNLFNSSVVAHGLMK